MRLIIPMLLALSFATSANGQTRLERQVNELIARPPASLKPRMQIRGDDLDTRVTITSEGVTEIVSKGLIASTTTENSFLRAYIDKKTGEVSTQIYHRVAESARSAPSIYRASYDSPTGPIDAEALRLDYDVSCARYGCVHYEDVAVTVGFDVLQAGAALYDPASPRTGLRYRLYGRSGKTYDDVIPANELVAFVEVVQERAKYIKDRIKP